MAHLILLNGNIASGKSSTAAELAKLGYEVISIDELRRKHNPNATYEGERLAIEKLLHQVHVIMKDTVVEITSASKYYEDIIKLHDGPLTIVTLRCPVSECTYRYTQRAARGYKMPPMPYQHFNVMQSIRDIAAIIEPLECDLDISSFDNTPHEIAQQIHNHVHQS